MPPLDLVNLQSLQASKSAIPCSASMSSVCASTKCKEMWPILTSENWLSASLHLDRKHTDSIASQPSQRGLESCWNSPCRQASSRFLGKAIENGRACTNYQDKLSVSGADGLYWCTTWGWAPALRVWEHLPAMRKHVAALTPLTCVAVGNGSVRSTDDAFHCPSSLLWQLIPSAPWKVDFLQLSPWYNELPVSWHQNSGREQAELCHGSGPTAWHTASWQQLQYGSLQYHLLADTTSALRFHLAWYC